MGINFYNIDKSQSFRYREEELASKDREILSLQKQLHSFEQELAGISKARETTVRENKRILDDLTLMTEDNQVKEFLIFDSLKRVSFCILLTQEEKNLKR